MYNGKHTHVIHWCVQGLGRENVAASYYQSHTEKGVILIGGTYVDLRPLLREQKDIRSYINNHLYVCDIVAIENLCMCI